MRFGGLSVLTDDRFHVTVKVGWQWPVSFDRCRIAACPDSDDLSQIVTLSQKNGCWEVIYNYY